MSKPRTSAVRRVVVVCHDSGGAQAVFQAVKALRRQPRVEISIIAGVFAQKLFRTLHPEMASEDWPEATIARYLEEKRPDLLLTSTSWKSRLEQGFRNYAHAHGIPSVVVLDFWSNYRLRWQHATYAYGESKDHVCVMDPLTARAMHREGYSRKKIHITGQPHLENCAKTKMLRRPGKSLRNKIRILFLSTPLAAMQVKQDAMAPLRVICEGLEQWCAANKKSVHFSIRLHPHEVVTPDLSTKLHALASKDVRILLANRATPLKRQILAHDLVMGYLSMALFEARCMGKEAIAIKIADYPPELLAAMKASRIRLTPFKAGSIASCLKKSIQKRGADARQLHRDATRKVVDLCRSLMAGHAK